MPTVTDAHIDGSTVTVVLYQPPCTSCDSPDTCFLPVGKNGSCYSCSNRKEKCSFSHLRATQVVAGETPPALATNKLSTRLALAEPVDEEPQTPRGRKSRRIAVRARIDSPPSGPSQAIPPPTTPAAPTPTGVLFGTPQAQYHHLSTKVAEQSKCLNDVRGALKNISERLDALAFSVDETLQKDHFDRVISAKFAELANDAIAHQDTLRTDISELRDFLESQNEGGEIDSIFKPT